MTNREKYLKDGVIAKELWETFQVYYYKNKDKESDARKAFRSFFEQEATPTLTEDERVILRNINNMCKTIYREKNTGHIRTTLYCPQPDGLCGEELRCFDNLFQFIKARRRI